MCLNPPPHAELVAGRQLIVLSRSETVFCTRRPAASRPSQPPPASDTARSTPPAPVPVAGGGAAGGVELMGDRRAGRTVVLNLEAGAEGADGLLGELDQVLPRGSSVVVVGGPERVGVRGRNARFEAWGGPVDAALEAALGCGRWRADRAIIAGSDAADSDAAALVAARRLMRARASAAADGGGTKNLHVVVAVQRAAAAAAVRETLGQPGVTADVVMREDLECGALAQVPRPPPLGPSSRVRGAGAWAEGAAEARDRA